MTGLSAIMYLYLLALGMFAVSVAADQIIIVHVDSSQTLEEQLRNISEGAMKMSFLNSIVHKVTSYLKEPSPLSLT